MTILQLVARSLAAKVEVIIVFSILVLVIIFFPVGRPKGGPRGSSKAPSNQGTPSDEAVHTSNPRKKAPSNHKVCSSSLVQPLCAQLLLMFGTC